MKPPAFQFYPDDFIGGTCDMTAKEVGAFIRLLCFQWSKGKIPSCGKKLARIAGTNVTPDVLAKFNDGMNQRLENERAKLEEYRKQKAASGKNGAQKRWQNHSTPIVSPLAEGMANDSSPSPSPSPSTSLTESAPPPPLEGTLKLEPKPAKKEKPPTDPRFKPFLEIFAACYAEGFHAKWVMSEAKDGKALSSLLKDLPDLTAETWQEALEWCQRIAAIPYSRAIVGHTGNLAAFCSNWSSIVAYSQTYQEPKK